MIFKKISMEYAQYGEEDIPEMKSQLDYSCTISQGPYGETRANLGHSISDSQD